MRPCESSVLVVDDDDELREALLEILELEGYRAVGVEHGKVAVEVLTRYPDPPCLILLDLRMPVMDGKAFLKWFRDQPSPVAEVPIVVVTAATEANTGALGDVELMRKPVDAGALLEKVGRHCPCGR